ncbi:hypothetical protein C0993_001793 [Termitomyces sp. T159_Od127]|nr:hypothetical protein C0993_001793 [Termitomyces sp. T159_Od127]
MHTHLTNLVVLKESLAKINCSLSNASFASYIDTSLSLAPTYKPLLMMLSANAHVVHKPISSQDLIWHLTEEANNAVIESSINQQHEAMVVAHTKAKSESKNGKCKFKPEGKGKDKCHCKNCDKNGHTEDQCFEDGGRMARKAPELWLKKHKGKGKDKAEKSKSANAIETEDKDENYAFLTFLTIDTPDHAINDNVELAVTSGHNHKAYAVSPSTGIIIDCSASSHFLLSHGNVLDYQEINPEPI